MANILKEVSNLPSAQNVTTGLGDYLHIKQGASDRKIRVYDLFKWHTDPTVSPAGTNPHGTTKTDVGLSNIVNQLQLVRANDLTDVQNTARARTHLDVFNKAEVNTAINAHTVRTDNPHRVSKAQVGLGAVHNFSFSTNMFEVSDIKYATIGTVARTNTRLDNYINSLTGQVIMHLGTTVPDGWLQVIGQSAFEIEEMGYPVLAAWVRSNYGQGRLPDTRGLFPRGWGRGTNVDPNVDRGIGSVQGDAFPSHNHTCSTIGNHKHGRGTFNITGRLQIGAGRAVRVGLAEGSFFASHRTHINYHGGGDGVDNAMCNFDASRSWTGESSEAGAHTHAIGNAGSGTETRPKNFAVMFIIKHDNV